MKKQLHPGTIWYLRFSFYRSFLFLIVFLTFFSFAFLRESGGVAGNIFRFFIYIFIIIIVIILVLGEIYARMAYNRWFYEFTENQLRMERGIIWKRYSNLPYERIQNVDITRGIIARIFGFSTVMIQTAGFSYNPNQRFFAEGYIPGVSIQEAEYIREFLMKKISKKVRDKGL